MDNSHLSSVSSFGGSRRGFLRGLGASLALPALDSMRPLLAAGIETRAIATTASGAPLRMAYLYVPNGVNQENWWPGKGSKHRIDGTFSPMGKLGEHFQTFRGFEHKNATSGKDGPGHHARGNATFLTGVRARKTAGSDIHLGISVDQVAANAVADHTRHLSGVREVEKQIEKVESLGLPVDPGVGAPKENPENFSEQLRLLMDMMVLAFKTDSTRIATMMLSNEGSNRSFGEVGVSEGHHSISHHQNNKDKLQKLAKIDRFYMENLAYFLDKLRNTEDVDGKSILHNSMIVYGSCISDGNKHNNNDLPIVLAGNGGGVFKPGGFSQFDSNTPLSNLHLRMLHEMGVKPDRFGDSTGIIKRI